MSGQFSLLKNKRFAPFFTTQFLGAFNDNMFKNALIVLLTFHTAQWTTLAPELLANLAAGIFILPFFLFSATAGQLADKNLDTAEKFYLGGPGGVRAYPQGEATGDQGYRLSGELRLLVPGLSLDNSWNGTGGTST